MWQIKLAWMMFCVWFHEAVVERVYIWLAWHLPRRVVYWAAIRLLTANEQVPDDGSAIALVDWEIQ